MCFLVLIFSEVSQPFTMSGTPIQEDEALVNKLYKISATLDSLAVNGSQEKVNDKKMKTLRPY